MNKLIIAGAGVGKTTYLVKQALNLAPATVLITTFTDANENSIKEMFYSLNGCIPSNVTILTWFSFLITHGIKPYQSYLIDKKIRGISLDQSNEKKIRYLKDNDEKKYISDNGLLYTISMAKGVWTIDKKSNGAVFGRIEKVFDNVFIDEVQDLSGYDLEIVSRLSVLDCNLLLVGDPRQATYQTHHEAKNKKYGNGNLLGYIRDNKLQFDVDSNSLSETYRCHPQIMNLANFLYPLLPQVTSHITTATGHDGVFWVNENDVNAYIESFDPVVLRHSKKVVLPSMTSKYNSFGNSKGLTYDRVLILPTNQIYDWFTNGKELKPTSLAKFYVAITRARYSVGIVYKGPVPPSEKFGIKWDPAY